MQQDEISQNDVIEMAKAAHRELVTEYYVGHHGQIDAWTMLLLERFAKLVADAATAKEREACAKVCENLPAALEEFDALGRAADAIRARGQT